MKKFGSFLVYFGFFILICGPMYQTIDQVVKNQPSDGVETFGDNPIFRKILGVKNVYSYLDPGEGWTPYRTEIQTPLWMQAFGLPEKVERSEQVDIEPATSSKGYWNVVALRWLVKLSPILFIIIGIRLKKLKQP